MYRINYKYYLKHFPLSSFLSDAIISIIPIADVFIVINKEMISLIKATIGPVKPAMANLKKLNKRRTDMNSNFIIGIAGGSGSGKSTFAHKLVRAFPDSVALINCDNYYKKRDNITFEERQKINYDSPEACDFNLLIEHIKALKKGNSIESPIYDFTQHNRSEKTLIVQPKPIIIIDGILIFSVSELLSLMDMKIYVDVDSDVRILRRIKRDVNERGRDLEDIIKQYLTTVKPMHDKYVEPSKIVADIIINGDMKNNAFDLVKNKIENLLKNK